MTRCSTARTIVSFALMVAALRASAAGVWCAHPDHLAFWQAQHTRPEFVLMKTATFGKTGEVKLVFTFDVLHDTCGRKMEVQGWVSHRLEEKEELTPAAGAKVGVQIEGKLEGSCFTSVELDIEPLPQPPKWLGPFAAEVRKVLSAKYAVRLAIPPVTAKALKGLSWRPDAALEALADLDGYDLMVYDTGPADVAEYKRTIGEQFDFADRALAKYPKKTFVVGLPAYKTGNPTLHPAAIESLEVVQRALQELPRDKAKLLCGGQVRLAYYPDPDRFHDKNKTLVRDIEKWKAAACEPKKG